MTFEKIRRYRSMIWSIIITLVIVSLVLGATFVLYFNNFVDETAVSESQIKFQKPVEKKSYPSDKEIEKLEAEAKRYDMLEDLRAYQRRVNDYIEKYDTKEDYLNSIDSFNLAGGVLWHGDRVIDQNVNLERSRIWERFESDGAYYLLTYNWKACGGCVWAGNLFKYNRASGDIGDYSTNLDFRSSVFSPDKTKVITYHSGGDNAGKVLIYDLVLNKSIHSFQIEDDETVIKSEGIEGWAEFNFEWINTDREGKADAKITVTEAGKMEGQDDYEETIIVNIGDVIREIVVNKDEIWK